ncbi:hypothetical protein E2C01_091298 [Portunus trituberculatus]|uniref:Ig-like domain-containing protein n=1 Tax=Portunus trituberculatus TaxID=210409 RepID=A0A5B7JDL7_PORTR|nr:hypothetical protein [Portunus trituberculatus]
MLTLCVVLTVVPQSYLLEAESENVIRGNSAILKCKIPSFVADFVSVQAWVDSEGTNYYPSRSYGKEVEEEWRDGGKGGEKDYVKDGNEGGKRMRNFCIHPRNLSLILPCLNSNHTFVLSLFQVMAQLSFLFSHIYHLFFYSRCFCFSI